MSNVQELSRSRADRFLGLFANEDMVDYGTDGVGRYAPNVPKALDTLSRDRGGFLLFLAEEGIDDMSHENNAHGVIDAGKALEATVAEVLRFVKTHPDTLVIINGDHETGGLTIEDGPSPIPGSPLRFSADWTTHDHTSAATPLTATGPGSDRLEGTIDNTGVYHAIMAASGWEQGLVTEATFGRTGDVLG